MSKTSRFALVAAAGLMFGATIAPANAADLGGDCCADLEERVAELEATTARKGNRVVSLQVYGQVNKALLFFDSPVDSDVFVVDNDNSSSRLGFQGKASLKPGWSAGYNMEFDLQSDSNSNRVTEFNDEGSGLDLRIRKNELYVESEALGRFTIGQGSNAGDGITGIVLANSQSSAALDYGGSLAVAVNAVGPLGFIVDLDSVVTDLGSSRSDRVRYDSPSIYGFVLSASWGEDDLVDVALRFKKEWNSIRIAAGVAYADQTDDEPGSDNAEFEQIGGSISVMHVPTGLYGAFAAGEREHDNGAEQSFWYAQAGIEKRFFSYGATTVYGEYGKYEGVVDRVVDFDEVEGGIEVDTVAADAEVTRWGFGIVQAIDSAAMDVYLHAAFWDYSDNSGFEDGDLTTVMVGSRIKF
jgi:predicted porin